MRSGTNARAGQQVPRAQDTLGDRIPVGVLAQAFPSEVVEAAVDTAGAREQRSRMLPACLSAGPGPVPDFGGSGTGLVVPRDGEYSSVRG